MEKNQSFEIAYSINPEETLNLGCLVLDFIKLSKDRLSHSTESLIDCLSPSQLRIHTTSSSEKEILNFLLKEEALYQQRQKGETVPLESIRIKKVHVHHQQISKALNELAPIQKLYCKGRQLVVDLYGEATFYYEGISINTQLLEVKGRIKWGQNDFSFADCSALIPGNPSWVVFGISLKKMIRTPSWKELVKLKQSSLILEGREKKHFLDDLDPLDSDSAQLIMKDGFLHDCPQQSPFPLLKLTDKWGAFANLWMDYGEGHYVPYDDPRPSIKNNEGKLICKRQLKDEDQWEKDLLETDFIKKNVGTSHYYCPLDKVAKSLTFLIELGWNIEDCQRKKVIKESGLNLQFVDHTQNIQIKGELKYDEHT
ncbi:MAG: hypothetical protein Q8K60_09690, partial [Parachlamydiaceae bacterium]|nr:hypothetical protein [Parachlamydiaceae bacterium]